MADGTNIPLVEEDRRADTGHGRADSKNRRSFGLDNALRSILALIRKLGVADIVWRERFVNGDAAECCSRPCGNLRISMHAQDVEIY